MFRFLPVALAILAAMAADARVYRCDGAHGVTYQQTPCKGEVPAPAPAAEAEPETGTGYNAACTHYNGRRVLPLAEVSALPEAQRDEYLEWLLSDDAPTSEEKQACLTGKHEADPEAAAADAEREARARAGRDALAALEAYSHFRTFARQISVCRHVAPDASDAAQDRLDSYLSEAGDLHAEGRRLARVGVSADGDDGPSLTPAQIEAGIRDKETAITERFRQVTPDNRAELEAECKAVAGLIEFQQSLATGS